MPSVKSVALLLAGASAFALPSIAAAQSSDDGLVITGSRVIRNGNASPTPVTVVGVEEALRTSPTTIAEALNNLPVFSGSRGQFSNPSSGTGQTLGGGNSASNNLNLRNMGSARTLVLYDGLRVPPTNVSNYVDVDMIPQMLLQRVDVVTGGASAVYGSDAVTGVVNFITDRNFNGIKANAQYGITQLGDGVSYNAGIVGGMQLGDRAHIEASYEFRDDRGIPSRHSRKWGQQVYSVQGTGVASNPYYLTADARVNTSSFGGQINLGTLNGMQFARGGALVPFVRGAASGTNGIEIGGDGVYGDVSLRSSLESHQYYLRGDFDLSNTTHAYLTMAANNKINGQYTGPLDLNNIILGSQNAFLLPAARTTIAAAGTTFRISKRLIEGPREHPVAGSHQIFWNGGLEGEFGDSYKWNVGFVHSTAELTVTNPNAINNGKRAAALDAVVNPANGQIVCNVTLTNPGLYPGCVPLNVFGPGSESAEALAYIQTTTQLVANTNMDDISGSISGSPLATWAGPVDVALSGEWRRIKYGATSSSLPTDLLNCTGLRFNCTAGTTTLYSNSTANRSDVAQVVSEAAVEVNVPLLKDAPLAESLNVNGAARFTRYDTSGDYTTWKLGLDWNINNDLRVRATRSRDIRAPTLDDLFSPASVNNNATFTDLAVNPPTGLTVTGITTIGGGNPTLKAEVGNTWTGGVVYRPSFISGLSLAVDYFDITVSDAIINLLATNSTYQRACADSLGTSAYCFLYTRPFPYTNTTAANAVTVVRNTVINIAEQHSNGVDVELNYATRVFDRPASLRLLTTYQPNLEMIQPGIPTLNNAGVSFGTNAVQAAPVWRFTGFLRFSPIENFDVSVQTRWRSSLKHSADPTHVISSPDVAAVSYTNMNFAYSFQALGKDELFLNVSNIFNQQPPPAAFYGSQTNPGGLQGFPLGDDPVGRAYTVGIRLRY